MKKKEGASLNISYKFDHSFLNEPVFDELTGSLRTTVLHVLCAVRWFTKGSVGYLDLYYDKFADDIGVGKPMVAKACKYLVDKECIKIARYYQQKGNTPYRYVAGKAVTRGTTKNKKVGTSMPQGSNQESKGSNVQARVYNTISIIKQNNDGTNIPHNSLMDEPTAQEMEWRRIEEQLKQKQ